MDELQIQIRHENEGNEENKPRGNTIQRSQTFVDSKEVRDAASKTEKAEAALLQHAPGAQTEKLVKALRKAIEKEKELELEAALRANNAAMKAVLEDELSAKEARLSELAKRQAIHTVQLKRKNEAMASIGEQLDLANDIINKVKPKKPVSSMKRSVGRK